MVDGLEAVAALSFCWSALGVSTGKRLAPVLLELVPASRPFVRQTHRVSRLNAKMSAGRCTVGTFASCGVSGVSARDGKSEMGSGTAGGCWGPKWLSEPRFP